MPPRATDHAQKVHHGQRRVHVTGGFLRGKYSMPRRHYQSLTASVISTPSYISSP
ncbi:hypothetical protein RP20_CCG008588 [Aedes albopictus]|nr:hypothetical protein RP20_CCG008588 [Aedes albopictus]